MVKSSKLTLKFGNATKRQQWSSIVDEYRRVTQLYVDLLWNCEKIPKLLNKSFTSQVPTFFSVDLQQASAKQASGIVRGVRSKQRRMKFVITKLNKEGCFKKARKLQAKLDKLKVSKPELESIELQLSSKTHKINFDKNNTSFDGWLTLSNLGTKKRLEFPLKKHKQFLKLAKTGKLKSSVRVSKNSVCLTFDMPEKPNKDKGKVLGIDIGINSLLSCSNGYQSPKQDIHGWTLKKIIEKQAHKKYNSKAFLRAREHQYNFINWSINQLNLRGIKQINVENLTYMKYKTHFKKNTRLWSYPRTFGKLGDYCSTNGVRVEQENPAYTSQRCSRCGWTQKRNRHGERFKCAKCGFTVNADVNAAINLSLSLSVLTNKKGCSRAGFYWPLSQELIVPDVQGTEQHLK
jgi:putative transposase